MFVAGGAKGLKVLTGDDVEHLRVAGMLAGTRVYALAVISAPSGTVVYAGTDGGVQRAADAALAFWRPVNGRGAGALPAGVPVTALAAAPGLLLAATPAGTVPLSRMTASNGSAARPLSCSRSRPARGRSPAVPRHRPGCWWRSRSGE